VGEKEGRTKQKGYHLQSYFHSGGENKKNYYRGDVVVSNWGDLKSRKNEGGRKLGGARVWGGGSQAITNRKQVRWKTRSGG